MPESFPTKPDLPAARSPVFGLWRWVARGSRRGAAALRQPRSALLVVVFCIASGIGMVWSVLSVYATALGAGAATIGFMISLFGGARVVASMPSGIASERFGRRPVMIAGLAFLTLSSFPVVAVNGIAMLMAFLIAQGLGEGMYLTSAMAAVADLSGPEGRVRDMAAYQGAILAGMSVGPALGGFAAARWGFGAPFLLQGMLGVLALAAMVTLVPPAAGRSGTVVASPRSLLRIGAGFGAMAALVAITYGVYFTRIAANWVLMPLIAQQDLGMGIAQIGGLYTVGAISNLVILPVANFAAQRSGRLPVVLASGVVMLASLAALATARSPASCWLASVLMGASTGLVAPLLSAYAIDAAPPGGIGAATGTLRTAMDLAFITAPVVVGVIVDQFALGYAAGLCFAAALLVVTTTVFCASRRNRN